MPNAAAGTFHGCRPRLLAAKIDQGGHHPGAEVITTACSVTGWPRHACADTPNGANCSVGMDRTLVVEQEGGYPFSPCSSP